MTITVNPVNDAPVAVADAYTTDEDTPLVVNAADGVLDNDSDPDGDPLSGSGRSRRAGPTCPEHGTVTLGADGSFTYIPDAQLHRAPTSSTYVAITDGTLESGRQR